MDALAISQLGKAFGDRLNEERARMEGVLAEREGALARLESTIAEARARVAELEGQRDEARSELATLREQLRALAQEATEARFARGEAESALQAQKEQNAALAEAYSLSRSEAESRIGEARDSAARAEVRIAALTRNARAREAMLQEAAQEACLQGQLASLEEKARGDRLASQVATLALVLRKSGRPSSAMDAVFEGLGGGADGLRAPAQSLDEAVRWLALHAGPSMAAGNDAGFEVAAASRWTDETWIAAAYRWLLGRPVDDAGRAHYAGKLGGAMTRRDMLVDLASSPEARSRLAEASAVRGAEDRHFVMAAYVSLLDRGADTGGLNHYLARIEAGMSRAKILLDLARSAEAREAATPVGTSLLAIWQAGQPRNRWRERLRRLVLRRLPGWRHAWEAGRLAGLQCEVALAQEATGQQLGELGRQVEQRVAAARETALASAPGGGGSSIAASGISASAQVAVAAAVPTVALGESSQQRRPGQIVGLIRQELKELDL